MPSSLTHHHDAFFKQFMSRPELARTFLREHLPPQVAQLLEPDLPEQVAGSYVDEELAVGSQLIRAALQPLSNNRRERIMGHFSEEFVEQGRAEGGAKVLVRFLERRFGGVSRSLRERIFASDLATIEAWFDRALDARELQSVFEPKAAA
jgi:hypothetical protein